LKRHQVESCDHVLLEAVLVGGVWELAVEALGEPPDLLDEVELAIEAREEDGAKATRGAQLFESRLAIGTEVRFRVLFVP
jgi:hypothetical protein